MASEVQANLGGGVNVTAVKTSTGIQYTINLASGATAGPYTGEQLLNVGTGLQTFPPPATFRLTYGSDTIATSQNPNDIANGENIVPNLFGIQEYSEKQLAQATETNAADQPATNEPAVEEKPVEQKLVPGGGGSEPYDELGNLNPGWEQDEVGNPYYVGTDMVPKTEPTPIVPGPNANAQSDPYDELGNLNPGWNVDELGQPYYVGFGEIQKEPKPVTGPSGTPYDDDGNLNPGWTLDEENNPVWVGGDFVEPATQALADEARANAQGLAPKTNTQSQATQQDTNNFYQTGDWRVRLSLAPSADYLYKAKGNEGILLPLAATNGVLFPYTPSVSVQYAAHYDASDITHSNYKTFQYKSSSVDSFTISCDFTAQDTFEANYLLAVIHFFRSVTKMFYGQDENPKNGTPPPLCYLTGFGAFQFDRHPLAITGFTYTLPTDVDYIRATNTTTTGGVNKSPGNTPVNSTDASSQRLGGLPPGGGSGPVNWQNTKSGSREPTYVPTKMQIQITAVPIVTRNDISRNFSLRDYATADLLRGSKRKQGGGGIW
jgi:hypothetical protein